MQVEGFVTIEQAPKPVAAKQGPTKEQKEAIAFVEQAQKNIGKVMKIVLNGEETDRSIKVRLFHAAVGGLGLDKKAFESWTARNDKRIVYFRIKAPGAVEQAEQVAAKASA